MKLITLLSLLLVMSAATAAFGQAKPKFNYTAQKRIIPAELGQVYLGMPLRDFAARIDVSKAIADDRFDPLELEIPYAKGNIVSLTVRVHGLSMEEKAALLRDAKAMRKGDNGEEYEADVKQFKSRTVFSKGFVYSMYVGFKKEFDLKKYLDTLYGKGTERAADDPYHFYDTEWVKTTPDGLVTLIRAFHKNGARSLQLLGRIDGTEWDPLA